MDQNDRHVAVVAAVFLLLSAAMIVYSVLEASPLLPGTVAVSATAGDHSGVPESERAVSEEPVSRISLSQATEEDLCQIPKIGPVLAQRILHYRDTYGPLSSLEELRSVEGVGEKLYETLCDYLTLD